MKQCDPVKQGTITVENFLAVLNNEGIFLSDNDQQWLREKMATQGVLAYKEVVRLIVMEVDENGQEKGWFIKNNAENKDKVIAMKLCLTSMSTPS